MKEREREKKRPIVYDLSHEFLHHLLSTTNNNNNNKKWKKERGTTQMFMYLIAWHCRAIGRIYGKDLYNLPEFFILLFVVVVFVCAHNSSIFNTNNGGPYFFSGNFSNWLRFLFIYPFIIINLSSIIKTCPQSMVSSSVF